MAAPYEDSLCCAVCLEVYDDPRFLPCGHSFCLKCLVKLPVKISDKSVMTCPMCQAESSPVYGSQASYTKNYELNSLVQSFILESQTQDSPAEERCCELCDCDPATPAKRTCVECEVTYCEKCFSTCHPMRGKFGKHEIVSAEQPFKRQKVITKHNKNMFCNDCDIILSAAGIGAHNKHDIVSLEKACVIFKVKLEEATGNVDLMQPTLKSSLDKSKEKLKAVVSMFEEIERDVASTKAVVLSKLGADIKTAEAAINKLLPAISTHRELQTRADMISFIEECQKTLRRSSLKQDFRDALALFASIDRLSWSSAIVLKEIKKFEVVMPVKESMVQPPSTSDLSCALENTSCTLDNIDEAPCVLDEASCVLDEAPCVLHDTPRIPGLQFDHQRAGKYIRLSRDRRMISYTKELTKNLVGYYHPESKVKQRYANIVLGNPHILSTGRFYWEVEAAHVAGGRCHFHFGVTSSSQPEACDPIKDTTSWGVYFDCDNRTTTLVMRHADQCLHKEISDVACEHLFHRNSLLLDVDRRSLSVIDVKSRKRIYSFTNIDTTRAITPFFSVYDKMTLRLVNPKEIKHAFHSNSDGKQLSHAR